MSEIYSAWNTQIVVVVVVVVAVVVVILIYKYLELSRVCQECEGEESWDEEEEEHQDNDCYGTQQRVHRVLETQHLTIGIPMLMGDGGGEEGGRKIVRWKIFPLK